MNKSVVKTDLSSPQNTLEIIRRHGFAFQKKYGQNFLIDSHVLDKIIAAADITPDDMVLEIGPGIGTMTQRLAERARWVAAVEIDANLIPILEETLAGYENIKVFHEDILKMDIPKLALDYNEGRPIKVVANLPYYITVMVQKEVADRMQSGPGSKEYGALSLAVRYYAQPYLAANVPPNCFIPRPGVGSAVIRLTRHQDPPVETKDRQLMFRLIRASFNQRRKTLLNGLYNSPELGFTKEEIAKAIETLGLPAAVRGEALTLGQFAELSNLLAV